MKTNIRKYFKFDEVSSEMDSQATRTGEVYGSKVKMVLTEVVNDQNIKYLNTDDDDEPGVELYVTQASTKVCIVDGFFLTFLLRPSPREPVSRCPCWTPSSPQPTTTTRH